MRCELANEAPGPCVLQSPVIVGEPSDLAFCCVEMEASSDNVAFQLAVISNATTLVSRELALQYVDQSFSGSACVAVPTTSQELYRIKLSATSYFASLWSAEWAEVSSFRFNAEDPGNIGS